MKIIGFPGKAIIPEINDFPWDSELGKPHITERPEIVGEAQAAVMSPASEILKKASGLIDGERHIQHGDRKECHTLIARLWTAYLGVQITPREVALMMVLLKVARTRSGAYNGDSYVDLCGYGSLAGEFADAGC